MGKLKYFSIIFLLLFSFIILISITSHASTINVPADYSTIQDAINNASDGDIISVSSGSYYEDVIVNKSITIVGQDKNSTFIYPSSTGFSISVNNVSISDFSIIGGSLYGIYAGNNSNIITNITIKDCIFDGETNRDDGIKLNNVKYCNVTNNLIKNEYTYGIYITSGGYNNISYNEIKNSGSYGLGISYSSNNTIKNNTLSGNGDRGIVLWSGSYNHIYYNTFLDNGAYNGQDSGSNNTWDDNVGKGNYWDDYTGNDADGDGIGDTPYSIAGSAGAEDRYPIVNIPVSNLIYVDDDASSSWYDATHVHTIQEGVDNVTNGGIVYVYSGTYHEKNILITKSIDIIGENRDTTIVTGNNTDNYDIFLVTGSNITIIGFTFENGGELEEDAGVELDNNQFVSISNCKFDNIQNGVYTYHAENISIINSEFYSCPTGIWARWGNKINILDNVVNNCYYGILFSYTDSSFVHNMTVTNSTSYAILMSSASGYTCDDNKIFNNNLSDNGGGIDTTSYTSNNIIYHNNLINNTNQAKDNGVNNIWYDISIHEGNYWSDYNGSDNNWDGIGDTPYNISGGASSQDLYPLMHPYTGAGAHTSKIQVNPPISVGIYTVKLSGTLLDAPFPTECGFWIVKTSTLQNTEPSFTTSSITYNLSSGIISSGTTYIQSFIIKESSYKYWVKAWAMSPSGLVKSINTVNFTLGRYSNMWDNLPQIGYVGITRYLDLVTTSPNVGSPYYGSFCLQSNSSITQGFTVTKWLSDGINNFSLSFYLASNGSNNTIKTLYYNTSSGYNNLIGNETIYNSSTTYSSWTKYDWTATFPSINKSRINKIVIIFSGGSNSWLDADNIIVNVDGWNTVYESFGDEFGINYPMAITEAPSDITPFSAKLYGWIFTDGFDPNGSIGGFKIWDDNGDVYFIEAGTYFGGDHFNKVVSNLNPDTKYYVKAYANNTAGQGIDRWYIYTFTTPTLIYSPVYCFTTQTINISNEIPTNGSSNVTISPAGVNLSVNVTHPYSNGTLDLEWYYYDWSINNFTLLAIDRNITTGNYTHLCPYFNQSNMVYYWMVDAYEHNESNNSIHTTQLYHFSSENFTINLTDEIPLSGSIDIPYSSDGVNTSVYLNYSAPSSFKVNLTWYWYDFTNATWIKYGEDLNVGEGRYYHYCKAIDYYSFVYWKVMIGNITAGLYNFTLYNYSAIQILFSYPPMNSTISPSNAIQTEVSLNASKSIPANTTLKWYYYDWAINEWILYGENSSISNHGTYRQYLTYPRWGMINYYWRVDAEIFPLQIFNFSLNQTFLPSNILPAPASTVTLLDNNSVKLQININHIFGKKFNLSFYFLQYTFNSSGYIVNSTWENIKNFTNVGNGTYYAYAEATPKFYPSITYYWMIKGKEVDNPLDPVIGTYNFTVANETPTVWLISPSNGSTNISFDNGTRLIWNASDPNNDTLTYWVLFGKDNSSNMVLVSLNQSEKYYDTGALQPNSTYYWQIVVWDNKGYYNVSEVWHFTTEELIYKYGVLIRNEDDFQPYNLDANATYQLIIYWKGNRTEAYTLHYNGIGSNHTNQFNFTELPMAMRLNVVYPIYNSTNHSIIDGYGNLYRTRIPMKRSENITFFLPKDPTTAVRYIYTVEDMTAIFTSPNVILRFFIYNETGAVGIVHEDWVTAEQTIDAFLVYNNRYYVNILNGQPPTVIYDAGITDADINQEKTITIYPKPSSPSSWQYIKYGAYKQGNNSIYIYFEDTNQKVRWVNITVYEYSGVNKTAIYNVNTTSYKFAGIVHPVNLSRYHEVVFDFSHSELGVKALTIKVFESYKPLFSYTLIDTLLTVVLGSNPFGWFASIVGILGLFVIFTFPPARQGLGIIAFALVMLFMSVFFGATGLLGYTVLTFILVIGFLVSMNEKKTGGGYQ